MKITLIICGLIIILVVLDSIDDYIEYKHQEKMKGDKKDDRD